MGTASAILDRIMDMIVYPTILVVFTLGLLLFFWGLIEYLREINQGKTNGNGRSHMVWGMVGMLIMVSVYGIISLIVNTLGIDIANPDVSAVQNIDTGIRFR